MKTILLVIDPQNDFCSPKGSLFVPGAVEDCERLAYFIQNNKTQIDSISVTLDSHSCYHVAHGVFWQDQNGNHPEPYTQITYNDFENGIWRPVDSSYNKKIENYLLSLESKGRYKLVIWPQHCIVGTSGSDIYPSVYKAINDWEMSHPCKNMGIIRKALNQCTEHYSAVQAEVPDPSDDSTKTNFTLIDILKEADRVYIAGEALSHCVANTVSDLAVYISPDKMYLLRDCASSVVGFEAQGEDFLSQMKAKGMNIASSSDIL